MKIATMATGGIGGYLAVLLTRAGHQVATIARGDHLAAIRAEGLRLEGVDHNETVRPWIATDNPAEIGPVDAIIFGVKGDGLPAAAKACLPLLGPQTVVVPFLNGVEAAERLAAYIPAHHIAEGVAKVLTTITAPGLITQTGSFNTFIFAERDNRPSARIAALQSAINDAGSNAPVADDIQRELWRKFILFSALSGVTATARCTIGDIKDHAPLAELFRAAMAETAALGRARGVALEPEIESSIWEDVKLLPPQGRASTAIDVEHGRPLEIEWVSGAVARLAVQSAIAAPINTALYALLLPYRAGRPNS